MVLQYKCPKCGADMAFDSKSGMLSCASCGHQEEIHSDDFQKGDHHYDESQAAENVDEVYGEFEDFKEEHTHNTYNEGEAIEYQCNNCGAVLVTSPDVTATKCSFCGAPMVLNDRLTGKKAPHKVIPFKISKEEAQASFKKWCKKGHFTPSDFMSADRIKEITGIYVPFWLYDVNGQGELDATCTKVRTYESGDYIFTETRYYDVYRKVDLNYNKVPVDASEKMDDGMMDKLEPFTYDTLHEFAPAYLAGYVAENYNYDDIDLFPRIHERTSGFVDTYVRSTIEGYASVQINNRNYNIRSRKADYTLLPVWMICYDYKDAEHNFAMNGETGKIVGRPPTDKKKVAAWFGGISASVFIILKIIGILMGGGIL